MIGLENIRYRAGNFTAQFDFTVPEGAFVVLIGPSGGGKTTLLSLIAGFSAPESGRIRIAGEDVTGLSPAERPVTMLFQEHNLFAHLTAAQNAGLGLQPSLHLRPEEDAQVAAALARVGLENKGHALPAALSGGERQRVALARAGLRNKPVLLLDEPFAGLGPKLRREMLGLVVELQRERGLTVLLVSHEPQDIEQAASLAGFVTGGQLAALCPPDAFFRQPGLSDYL